MFFRLRPQFCSGGQKKFRADWRHPPGRAFLVKTYLVILSLLVCAVPLLAQDATNTPPPADTNSVSYGDPAPGTGMPLQPPVMERPRRYDGERPSPQLARPMPPAGAMPRNPSMGQIWSNNVHRRPPADIGPQAIPPTHINIIRAEPLDVSSAEPLFVTNRVIPISGPDYLVEVCTNDADRSGTCLGYDLGRAELYLQRLYSQELAEGRHHGMVTVVFPARFTQEQQLRLLKAVESDVIEHIHQRIWAAEGHVPVRPTDPPSEQKQKEQTNRTILDAARPWADQAQAESEAGINWVHDWQTNSHTYAFAGEAYKQLHSLNVQPQLR
jgi:hypothetical protein